MTHKGQDKMSEIDEHITKRFDIKSRLGKGAYGIVWKATDKKTGETVAVKKIFDAFRNQTDSQRTFREIMFLQSFRNHPNIIQLHSIHRAANNRDIYLGFEYMDIDLHVVIKRGHILKECHHRYIMYQLFNATYYIHSGNVIHRDQKPSNVLLNQYCRCKIADFGLARSLTPSNNGDGASGTSCGEDCDPTLTDYVATRWYRAPEILIASKRYTKGIDMWSLGCILGEMLAGKPIFPGTSTVNQVEKIMSSIPTPSPEDIATVCSGIGTSMIKNAANGSRVPLPSLMGTNCPADALDLVNKLLVFNPNKRLNAEQALAHPFVAQYRNKSQEITLDRNVVPPLNDDIRLSIDDYRNKLYELMSHHTVSRLRNKSIKKSAPKFTTIETRKPEIVKIRTSMNPIPSQINKTSSINMIKEKHHVVSESKIRYMESNKQKLTSITVKSETRIPTPSAARANIIFQNANGPTTAMKMSQHRNSIGDLRVQDFRPSPPDLKEKQKNKRVYNVKSSFVYSQPFNSYNHNHGIITASALRELKSGVR